MALLLSDIANRPAILRCAPAVSEVVVSVFLHAMRPAIAFEVQAWVKI